MREPQAATEAKAGTPKPMAGAMRAAGKSPVGVLGLLAVLAATAVLISLQAGPAAIGAGDVLGVLLGGGDERQRVVVLELRLPRVALGLLVGGALAVAGAVFQALLRNPLADPYVLGVSGGAAAGSVAALALGLAAFRGGVEAGAVAGALLAVFAVRRVAMSAGPLLNTRVLLLAGVIAGAFFNAVVMLLLTMADAESFRSAIFWMMGSLARAGPAEAGLLAIVLIPFIGAAFALARPLDVMSVGEEMATYLGVRVETVKQAGYVAASLAVAASVAAAGVIGFVGLVVPHAVRLLWGGGHRVLLPASFLAGGTFLVLADTAARTVAAPQELPTGVVTALVGVPLFAVLLARSAR